MFLAWQYQRFVVHINEESSLKKKQSNRALDWIKFNENQYMYKVIKKERKYLY